MSAIISPCGRYRYRLGRQLPLRNGTAQTCLFVMLNPSTADAETDDPTIRKCMAYATRWGCTQLEVVNLFAWRATDPHDILLNLADANTDESNRHIAEAIRGEDRHIIGEGVGAALVVCAWGNGIPGVDGAAATRERASDVLALIRDAGRIPHRLRQLTKEGQPRHPLYLKGDLQPEPMP